MDSDHFSSLFSNWYNIPVNVLYGFGWMWVDVINYTFYNYQTVPQNDWGFFFFYTLGDFISRFFFNPQDGSDATGVNVNEQAGQSSGNN